MWASILATVLNIVGPPLLKVGLTWFETKVPNSKPVITTILGWLGDAVATGNTQAAAQLSAHMESLYNPTSGVAEPSTLK